MDSVTQFALGACVGMATLGRRIGVGKAALTGGLLGSVPDADVFWPFDDPVDRFVLHRSATHSLVIQALVTPVFAEALIRFFRPLREARWLGYLAVYLCFATHALLDTMTIYGTRLFWPVWQEPLAVGSVFIIDPLYTLPFLIVIVWGFFLKNWTPRFGKALVGAFVLSTAYLAWGVVAQQIAEARAGRILADAGVSPERIFATPTPFNSLLWRVVAIDGLVVGAGLGGAIVTGAAGASGADPVDGGAVSWGPGVGAGCRWSDRPRSSVRRHTCRSAGADCAERPEIARFAHAGACARAVA